MTSIRSELPLHKTHDTVPDTLIKQFLEHDPRPAFVLDLENIEILANQSSAPKPAFHNTAFTKDHTLTHVYADALSDICHAIYPSHDGMAKALLEWLCAEHGRNDSVDQSADGTFHFLEQTWSRWDVGRWRIVTELAPAARSSSDGNTINCSQLALSTRFLQDDWLEIPAQTPFVQWFKDFDWSSTPLGPTASWSNSLRHSVVGMLVHPRSQALVWYVVLRYFSVGHASNADSGPEQVYIYNEATLPILGSKHPALAKRYGEVWPAAWSVISDLRDQVTSTHVGLAHDEYCVGLQRHDYIEE